MRTTRGPVLLFRNTQTGAGGAMNMAGDSSDEMLREMVSAFDPTVLPLIEWLTVPSSTPTLAKWPDDAAR